MIPGSKTSGSAKDSVGSQLARLAAGMAELRSTPAPTHEDVPPAVPPGSSTAAQTVSAHSDCRWATAVLRRCLIPAAAGPPLLWGGDILLGLTPAGASFWLGVLAGSQALVFVILGLAVRGEAPSRTTVERVAVVGAAISLVSAALHGAAAPGSLVVAPMLICGALLAALMPLADMRRLACALAGGWAVWWFGGPDAIVWSAMGAGLAAAFGLAHVVRIANKDEAAERVVELERQREQYAELLESARQAPVDDGTQRILDAHGEMDGLWEWHLNKDQIYFSPRWRALLGYENMPQTGNPDTWFNLIHPYDLDELMSRLSSHIEGRSPYFECEHRVRQADGTYRWVLSHGRVVIGKDGKPERLAGSQTDIKRMKNFEAQLIHEATHDRLTGLANRQHLFEVLGEEFKWRKSQGSYLFAVAFLDLDRFKAVNDTLGHHVGDELLRTVAGRLADAVREQDLTARLGGDEFVAVMRGVESVDRALEIAERIRRRIGEKIVVGSHEIATAASIGVAVSSEEISDPGEIMRNADIAMYQAKSAGRGRVLPFDSKMRDLVTRNFNLQNDLARAIESDEFELHYQPFVSPKTGRIRGAEALIRWRRADDELVFPAEFIGLAEESGMIGDIGEWVLNRACRQLNEWLAEGLEPIKISINLSALELAEVGALDTVSRVLKEWELDPQWLQVEITEGDLVDGRQSTVESLDRLSLMGVKTAIDDFGTGYSALAYLRKLPCDVLKIDQSFVHDIVTDPKAASLVRSIIGMAQGLELEVVAEGVETPGQLSVLREYGCDLIQGYLASRPVPAEEFRKLLETGCAEAIGVADRVNSSDAAADTPSKTKRSRRRRGGRKRRKASSD